MVVDVTCSEDESDTKIFNGKYSAIGELFSGSAAVDSFSSMYGYVGR